jgi:hypothetical protein
MAWWFTRQAEFSLTIMSSERLLRVSQKRAQHQVHRFDPDQLVESTNVFVLGSPFELKAPIKL